MVATTWSQLRPSPSRSQANGERPAIRGARTARRWCRRRPVADGQPDRYHGVERTGACLGSTAELLGGVVVESVHVEFVVEPLLPVLVGHDLGEVGATLEGTAGEHDEIG